MPSRQFLHNQNSNENIYLMCADLCLKELNIEQKRESSVFKAEYHWLMHS